MFSRALRVVSYQAIVHSFTRQSSLSRFFAGEQVLSQFFTVEQVEFEVRA
jgi:hypothetical protein